MKYLIFGGAGFIGNVLARQLLYHDNDVVVADNLFKGGTALLSLINSNHFHFEYCDVTNEADVKKCFALKPDYVINLAGIVGYDDCNKYSFLANRVNIDACKIIANYIRDIPCVHSSTGSVYGALAKTCTDDLPVNPISHYSVTKYEGEKIMVDAGAVALRFATCAGVSQNMRLNLLPNELTYEAVTKGHLKIYQKDVMRTFMNIKDFCFAYQHFLKHFNQLKYRIYNVGTEKGNWTKEQLVECIKEKTGCSVEYVKDGKDVDARNYWTDFSRATESGFIAKYTIEETIDELILAAKLMNKNFN